jgi:hypothetical protein
MTTWEPIELELERGGYLARVTRQLTRSGRWRWTVTPVEVVQKFNRPIENAYARGYARGRDGACRAAEAAINALKAAEKAQKKVRRST